MEPQFSLSIKKMAHFGFASILEDSIRFPKKDQYLLPLISDLLDTPWWAQFTPRLTSDMHTILSELQLETNGKPCSEPDTVLSSGQ